MYGFPSPNEASAPENVKVFGRPTPCTCGSNASTKSTLFQLFNTYLSTPAMVPIRSTARDTKRIVMRLQRNGQSLILRGKLRTVGTHHSHQMTFPPLTQKWDLHPSRSHTEGCSDT